MKGGHFAFNNLWLIWRDGSFFQKANKSQNTTEDAWVESNKNSTNNHFFLALKIHALMLQQGLKNCVLFKEHK